MQRRRVGRGFREANRRHADPTCFLGVRLVGIGGLLGDGDRRDRRDLARMQQRMDERDPRGGGELHRQHQDAGHFPAAGLLPATEALHTGSIATMQRINRTRTGRKI